MTVVLVPLAFATTESAILEVGNDIASVLIASTFTAVCFFVAFKLDKKHMIMQLLFLFMAFAGLVNLTAINASYGGVGESIYKIALYSYRIFYSYVLVYLFWEIYKWKTLGGTGGVDKK